MPRSSHPLIWTRRHDVFKTPSAFLSVSESRISLSQLSCYASVQLRHLLIHNSCSLLVHPHTKHSPLPLPFFFPLLPAPPPKNCNFGVPQHKICLHHPISHSANGLCLLVCVKLHVTSRAGCHLFRRRHFVCSLQHSSSCLVILSSTGMRGNR